MGWFSRKEEQQLPVFTEVDALVGKLATDNEGTPGTITGVYFMPGGTKAVDLEVKGGITGHITLGCLDSGEYRLKR